MTVKTVRQCHTPEDWSQNNLNNKTNTVFKDYIAGVEMCTSAACRQKHTTKVYFCVCVFRGISTHLLRLHFASDLATPCLSNLE
jgi:hypothetical protein